MNEDSEAHAKAQTIWELPGDEHSNEYKNEDSEAGPTEQSSVNFAVDAADTDSDTEIPMPAETESMLTVRIHRMERQVTQLTRGTRPNQNLAYCCE